jgi:peptidoglycan hydrolase-like protein with peptidoglycan-binding domain
MIGKRIATAALGAALVAGSVSQARADADGLVGGLVGGIVGGMIVNEANRNRQAPRSYAPRTSSMSSATRAANRETQTALNYFGFNAGAVDGVMGRGSRAAAASYQALMGYPATGELLPYERDFLITSYQRAIAGGASTAQLIASNPMGTKGLLLTFRDQTLGVQPPVLAGTPQLAPPAVTPAAPGLVPLTPEAGATVEAAAPETGGALPNFLGDGPAAQVSLASHCNQVNLLTSSNGGFVTLASMTDPMMALNEQFCLARTYVIAEGERLAAQVKGFTPEQVAEQCEGLGPSMRDQIAELSLKSAPEVLQSVSAFALGSGLAPAQLSGTAKICLSVGYRTDNTDVALASALLLTGLGEPAYGELLGHHLMQGIGAAQRPDLARAWYQMGLDAAAAGARSVVAPGQPERVELLRRAVKMSAGGTAGAASVPAAAEGSGLPTFTLDQ